MADSLGSRNEARGMWWSHLGALAAGGVASFGFAPYAHRWALWIGLILFLSVLHSCSSSTALKRGLLFGLGYFGPGVYWVYYSVHHYANSPLWLAIMLAGILVVYLALYPMVAAWAGSPTIAERGRPPDIGRCAIGGSGMVAWDTADRVSLDIDRARESG